MAEPDPASPGLGSDADDDEALRAAIALSLQDQQQDSISLATKPAHQDPQQSETAFSLLSLNRRKMEEERLARMARKRARSPSDDEVVEVPPPRKKSIPAPSHLNATCTDSMLPYPNGTVKRTWVRGYPRTGDDIKIEEVLQKDKLLLAMLSSYQWDDDWILSKVDTTKTRLLLAAFASDDRQKEAMRANVPPHIRFCFPRMHGPGSMHSKLQILKFAHYLRVVVPTGNLVPYDWGETGVMENMVFLIDLPRLDKAEDHKPTTFSLELQHFLRAMGVEEKMVDSLSGYDFSKTASLGFVHTRPGGHMDESLKRVGYCGLGATVAALGLATTVPIEVDVACASLGSIKCDLVEAMYNACQGDDGMKEYTERTSRKPRDKHPGPSQLLKDRFRIYFPANQTVCDSRGGKAAAGTICVQAKWWRSPDFPTELVRDCVNTREGLLMHSKVIFVRKAEGSTANPHSHSNPWAGWAYVGSANLSESAWGRLVKDKKSGKAKMSCRNWECGVLVPVHRSSNQGSNAGDLGVFQGTVPIPMQVPGRAYRSDEEPFYDGA
ncbi:tyrosyl-DNA phosphodiesterase domain-containing protein [Hirsutella rhossiliensis]|uniref:Tyrosyl-DNA phosphodiesterase domain-containing protein n=1 Tax=Hirsutella rhossiliensis TaxID=111463 RepID=A0A9P8SFI3_9HYPO|nr:tyrosyl-DNA phosphodiesterase domain-containing protein [Hirsutella rhossiliensis]KAH0960064.1 tyrosyl-DNA phosphodiesterase domain-containing protein [Hirsutella rhossiliensis]